MDQYATWYGGRPRLRWHCVRWGPSFPPPLLSCCNRLLQVICLSILFYQLILYSLMYPFQLILCLLYSFASLFLWTDITWSTSPFPQIDIIGAMVIVWRVRGKIIKSEGKLSSLFCAILGTTIVHSAMHTHMNSSLDWVLSHWAHFTVLRFIFVYVLLQACVVL